MADPADVGRWAACGLCHLLGIVQQHQRGVADVQDWKDADLPHAVRDYTAACRAGWRGWKGTASTACALL